MNSGSTSGSGAPPGRDPQKLQEDLAKMKRLMAEAQQRRLQEEEDRKRRMQAVREKYPVSFLFLI